MKGSEMNKTLLFQYIEEAVNSIGENGEPDFTCRCKLRNLLGKEVIEGKQDGVIWFTAEILAAQKVLPIWEAAFPSDDMPAKLLYASAKHLLQPGPITIPEIDIWVFRSYLDGISSLDQENSSAAHVGYTCWIVACHVLLDMGIPLECKPEVELDMEEWDAPFHGSLPYSGGAVWEEADIIKGPIKRQEYWEWFFREAIPQAVARFY
jgi:hypothetical protein